MTLNSIKAGKMDNSGRQHLKPSEKTATLNDTKQANNIMGETSQAYIPHNRAWNLKHRIQAFPTLKTAKNPLNKLPKLIAILHPKPDPWTKPNINGKLKTLIKHH